MTILEIGSYAKSPRINQNKLVNLFHIYQKTPQAFSNAPVILAQTIAADKG